MSDTQNTEHRGLVVVRYNYNDNSRAREQTLPAHETFLRSLEETGDLALGGTLIDEPGVRAMLIVRAVVQGACELLAEDPMLNADVLESRELTSFIAEFGTV
jgi:uncharacterized protein YciI